jgi:hypothetical protein
MSSQVAVRQELAVVDIPEGEGTGLEGIDASDQIVPRLQIAAGTSKQVIEGSDVYIEGLRQGSTARKSSSFLSGTLAIAFSLTKNGSKSVSLTTPLMVESYHLKGVTSANIHSGELVRMAKALPVLSSVTSL